MARFAYFADLPDGRVIEWRDTVERYEVQTIYGPQRRAREIPARVWREPPPGERRDVLWGRDPDTGERLRVTRQIEMKGNPSRHACDSKCIHAQGKVMRCECACGGRNHGRGAFTCS